VQFGSPAAQNVFLQTAAGGLAAPVKYNGITGMGPEGDLALRCMQSSGTAHVVLEVNGYFTSPQP